MPTLYEDTIREALALGFTNAAELPVEKIRFSSEFRDICATNACGHYGQCWTCPPGCGPLEECIATVQSYEKGVLLQLIWEIEDSFDIEGMNAGADKTKELTLALRDILRDQYHARDLIVFSLAGCNLCEECAYLTGEPCRFPDKVTSSVEAYGMDVTKLMEACGFPYGWSGAKVYYTAFVLFRE